MIAAARRAHVLPRPTLLWLIAAAWGLAIVAEVSGTAPALHHHQLTHSRVPLAASLALFLLAWQVHIAAMMLPTSLPMIQLFGRAAASAPRPDVARNVFLAGYLAVWSLFGALAFLGDVGLHRLVHLWPWLSQHQWVIAGSTLLVAGAFQFSDLKQRCLSACRHPAAYLMRHYRRGIGAAFRMGLDHGLFCLGCCWALMLVMFGAGVANVTWMAPLALIMLVEKTAKHGDRLSAPVGVGLIALGVLVLTHPAWLPLDAGWLAPTDRLPDLTR